MKPKQCAVFRADAFPDDTVEDEHDIQVFPGKNIAEALVPILEAAGCTDVGAPSHEHEHGWHVYFGSGGKRFYLQVSRIEPETILLFEKRYGSEGLFYRGPSRLLVLLDKLRPLIASDPRFQGLTWYTWKEMNTVDWPTALGEPADHEAAGDA